VEGAGLTLQKAATHGTGKSIGKNGLYFLFYHANSLTGYLALDVFESMVYVSGYPWTWPGIL
jgi:hypothetical protein